MVGVQSDLTKIQFAAISTHGSKQHDQHDLRGKVAIFLLVGWR